MDIDPPPRFQHQQMQTEITGTKPSRFPEDSLESWASVKNQLSESRIHRGLLGWP